MPNDDVIRQNADDTVPPPADAGGAAPQGGGHQVGDDPTGNRPFISKLHTAIEGRALSQSFLTDMEAAADAIDLLLQNHQTIDVDNLPYEHLVQAAEMYTSDPDSIDVENVGKLKKIGLILRDKERLRQIVANKEAKAQLLKMIEGLGGSIADALEQAHGDAADNKSLANTRVKMLELATVLYDDKKFQDAFAVYEDATAIGRVVSNLEDRAQAPQGESVGDRQDTTIIQAHNPLDGLLRELKSRRFDQVAELNRLDGVLSTYRPVPDEIEPFLQKFHDAVRRHRGIALPEDDAVAAGDVTEDSLRNIGVVMNGIDDTLQELSRIGTEKAKAAQKASKKKLETLVHFDGSDTERSGANLTGAGDAVMRGKARDVPQSVVAPVLAKYDALRAMASVGSLTPDQMKMIEEFETEIVAEAQFIQDNLASYKQAAKALKTTHDIVDDDVFAFNQADKKLVELALQELEDAQNNLAPEDLTSRAETLKERALTAKGRAEDAKTDFKAKQKKWEKERTRVVEHHANILKLLFKVKQAEPEGTELKAKLKAAKNKMTIEGHYAQKFADMWKPVVQSDPTTYRNGSPFSDNLNTDPNTYTVEINALKVDIEHAKDRMAAHESTGEPKTLQQWIGERSDNNPVKASLSGALQEINDIHTAVEDTKNAKENFLRELSILKAFIEGHASGVDHDAREGFTNYLYLLDALKARTETCKRYEDWQDLDKELKEYDKSIKAYYGDHLKLGEEITERDAQVRTKELLMHVRRAIEGFKTDVHSLYDQLKGSVKTKADAAPDDDDAQAIVALIDNRDAELLRFISGLKQVITDDQSQALDAELDRENLKDDQRIALRERALAILRRRRMFLEQNSAALIYRNNPVDLGAPALALISRLAEAESRILSFFKRG